MKSLSTFGASIELSDLRNLDCETSAIFISLPVILLKMATTSVRDINLGPVGLYVLLACDVGSFSIWATTLPWSSSEGGAFNPIFPRPAFLIGVGNIPKRATTSFVIK